MTTVAGVEPETTEAMIRRARVLVVDDHELVRSGLRALLEAEDSMVVMGEAGTAEEAVRIVENDLPDLVLMDVRLPDRSGISACLEITVRFPKVKVLMLTAYADEAALVSARSARASGYLLKSLGAHELVDDVRRVLAGEKLFDGVTARLDTRFVDLSSQERVVAGYLARGLTNRAIAERMGLAEKTVKNYVSSLLTKLGMTRRSEAAAYAARFETIAGVPLVESDPTAFGWN